MSSRSSVIHAGRDALMEQFIQGIGLLIALGFVLLSVDDLIWDVAGIVRAIRRGKTDGEGRLLMERLDAVPPKLLAVMVAAWHEDNVLELVIDNMISSIQYPRSMYHVFIGVYPNDDATVAVARKLENKYETVHMVVNTRPGPTCKADNVNNIIRYIREFERSRRWRFSSVTIHDSEDVVHPYELKLTNYLIDSYDVLQFPVIPLQKMPKFKNVFRGLTVGTYADEFAENHYRAMGSREAMAAVVPSAGTGFALSHTILDAYGDEPLCPEDSLTEDYKLSLILAEKGFKTHFVLEKVPRLTDYHTVRWDYVATRSFFPDTFRTAVRQKTRWIYGITMQSAGLAEIFKRSKLTFAGRYSLYKDLKAKVSNLMVLPGYLVFIYFIASLFISLPYMYPQDSFAYGLCVFLTFMMVFRQLMRAVAITNFYGYKSMAVACLLPPLIPARLVWGNIINMAATFQAWKLNLRGAGAGRKKKKVAWNKTEHSFLHTRVLQRYYRNVGDVLLEKRFVGVSALSAALRRSRSEGSRIGEVLARQGVVTEEQLAEAVACVRHMPYVHRPEAFANSLADGFGRALLQDMLVYPLMKSKTEYVIAVAGGADTETIPAALGIPAELCRFVYAAKPGLLRAIAACDADRSGRYQEVDGYLQSGQITWEQAVLALDRPPKPEMLWYMGLDSSTQYKTMDVRTV